MSSVTRFGLSLLALAFAYEAHAADPVMYGDWAVGYGKDNSFMFAGTVNDSGEIFGEYCYFNTKVCNWYVVLNTGCETGTTTPVLANTDSGAIPLALTCKGQMSQGKFANEISDWKSLEAALTDSIHLGFAIPISEDKFIAVRFSLKGRTGSTQAMESAFVAQLKAGKPGNVTSRGTTDERL